MKNYYYSRISDYDWYDDEFSPYAIEYPGCGCCSGSEQITKSNLTEYKEWLEEQLELCNELLTRCEE